MGQQELYDNGQIRDVIASASNDYKTLAHDEKVTALLKIKYRNGIRKGIYQLADEMCEHQGAGETINKRIKAPTNDTL
ncbi:MAG: type restriction enzyme subunit [Eubacteriaceae bacterium]|nr:type restriction enzyme subunit [Eubacteriaceae bacterium]